MNNGGSAIVSYTVTFSPGNISATGITSPITVTGLTNGTIYSYTVVATTSYGAGAVGNGGRVTPLTTPGAPSISAVTAGVGLAKVTFVAPSNNGGSPVTSYTVTSTPGGFTGTGVNTNPITITGLTNGTAYTFKVTATNAAGSGVPSSASNAVTPIATVTKS
jgi:hypothetical protein